MEFEVIHSMSSDIICQNFYNMSNDMSSETQHIGQDMSSDTNMSSDICQVIHIM